LREYESIGFNGNEYFGETNVKIYENFGEDSNDE
jgi:hypothetical protein